MHKGALKTLILLVLFLFDHSYVFCSTDRPPSKVSWKSYFNPTPLKITIATAIAILSGIIFHRAKPANQLLRAQKIYEKLELLILLKPGNQFSYSQSVKLCAKAKNLAMQADLGFILKGEKAESHKARNLFEAIFYKEIEIKKRQLN